MSIHIPPCLLLNCQYLSSAIWGTKSRPLGRQCSHEPGILPHIDEPLAAEHRQPWTHMGGGYQSLQLIFCEGGGGGKKCMMRRTRRKEAEVCWPGELKVTHVDVTVCAWLHSQYIHTTYTVPVHCTCSHRRILQRVKYFADSTNSAYSWVKLSRIDISLYVYIYMNVSIPPRPLKHSWPPRSDLKKLSPSEIFCYYYGSLHNLARKLNDVHVQTNFHNN